MCVHPPPELGHGRGKTASLGWPSFGWCAALSFAAHLVALLWILRTPAPPQHNDLPPSFVARELVFLEPEAMSVPKPDTDFAFPAKAADPEIAKQPTPTQPERPVRRTPIPVSASPVPAPATTPVTTAAARPETSAEAPQGQADGRPTAWPAAAPAVPAQPSADSARSADDALRSYAKAIWLHIEQREPRRLRSPGTAIVTFSLATDGGLLAAEITRSSGLEPVDRAAIEAVHDAAPFPPPPPGVSQAQLTFALPFNVR